MGKFGRQWSEVAEIWDFPRKVNPVTGLVVEVTSFAQSTVLPRHTQQKRTTGCGIPESKRGPRLTVLLLLPFLSRI